MSLLRNSMWAGLAAITLATSRFFISAILARTLTQNAFGQYAYVQWLIDFFFLLCSFGLTGTASRYMAEYRHNTNLLYAFIKVWRIYAITLPFLAATCVITSAWLSEINITLFGYLMLFLWSLASGFWAMMTSAMIGLQRFDLIFRSNLIVAFVMFGGVLIIPSSEDLGQIFGLMAFACFNGALIGSITIHKLVSKTIQSMEELKLRNIGIFAINTWISALIASMVWSRGEFPILKSILGDPSIAQYTVALTVFGAAVQAVMLGVGGVASHISNLWGQDKRLEAVVLGRTIMDIQLLLSGLGSLFLIFFGSHIISIFFSNAYAEAARLLLILSLGLITFVVSSQSQLLQLQTNGRFNRNSILFGLLILYFLAFLLIPVYATTGAAIARIGGMLFIGGITIYFTVRIWGMSAVSFQNMFYVIIVLLVGFLFQWKFNSTAIMSQMLVFFIEVGFLLFSIRDLRGNLLIKNLIFRLIKHINS